MRIWYATWSKVIHVAITGIMVAGLCESLNLMVDQDIAASIMQQQIKFNELRFAVPDEEIPDSTPKIQK